MRYRFVPNRRFGHLILDGIYHRDTHYLRRRRAWTNPSPGDGLDAASCERVRAQNTAWERVAVPGSRSPEKSRAFRIVGV